MDHKTYHSQIMRSYLAHMVLRDILLPLMMTLNTKLREAVLFLLNLIEELPNKGKVVVSYPVNGWNYRLWSLGSLAFSTTSHRTK
jgi:hypothetical protein